MIKVNDVFSFERDTYCWQLHEIKDGINPKTKEATKTKHTTYHSNLNQVCKAIIDRTAGEVEELGRIATALLALEDRLNSAIKEASK